MHSLETIIAMNQTAKQRERREHIAALHGEVPTGRADKQASRERHFRKVSDVSHNPGPSSDVRWSWSCPCTLRDEAHETVTLYHDAPRLSATEQLLLRLAKEYLAAGLDGPAEFPVTPR